MQELVRRLHLAPDSTSGTQVGPTAGTRDDEGAAAAQALAVMMQSLGLETAVQGLLSDIVSGVAKLLSRSAGGQRAAAAEAEVELAALRSLAAATSAAKGRLSQGVLQMARDTLDPFLLAQRPAACSGSTSRYNAAASGKALVTARHVRAASVACLGGLASGAAWDSFGRGSMRQQAVWIMERLLLALADDDQDDACVREAALAALVHVAHALDDTFYPFLPLVRTRELSSGCLCASVAVW